MNDDDTRPADLRLHDARMATGCRQCSTTKRGHVCPDCYTCRACKPGHDRCTPAATPPPRISPRKPIGGT